ncbi:hypothetical protein AUJ46_05470 [Candidatus Peregrinibacteria bacterium CG1_02_54_53]|nr:MAG: hypothetical protein AUJ46_05470 [Candidatus Peregrinibacteria bacterium CG1_02_54_53]
MRKRTNVFLSKGANAPLYFHLVGIAKGHTVRIAHLRDWSVYHCPGWDAPIAMTWDRLGHERLFVTSIQQPMTHDEAKARIDQWQEQDDWTTHRHEYSGLVIPLVAHEKFVIVPEDGDIEEGEGTKILTFEPSCLFWHEWQKDGHEAATAATIIIR